MSYKIAVATSDGIHVDQSFGTASSFQIYQVTDEAYKLEEVRAFHPETAENPQVPGDSDIAGNSRKYESSVKQPDMVRSNSPDALGCNAAAVCGGENGCAGGPAANCASGAGCGTGGGCGGGGASPKAELLSDVRCLLCSKIGFQAQKQFEKKAVTVFEITGEIPKILDQITRYYARIDRHQSLRGWRGGS